LTPAVGKKEEEPVNAFSTRARIGPASVPGCADKQESVAADTNSGTKPIIRLLIRQFESAQVFTLVVRRCKHHDEGNAVVGSTQ